MLSTVILLSPPTLMPSLIVFPNQSICPILLLVFILLLCIQVRRTIREEREWTWAERRGTRGRGRGVRRKVNKKRTSLLSRQIIALSSVLAVLPM